ncbi:MAG: M23 family metallopeptidase [Candidatus Heimdallarchaeota archaeon]|nr:M23 family metallopeptidase [Thermodesulfovibrionia bacterium]MCK5409888.1 M23 family metallopeptidase [Candidatus Heimdallarchaeota archaeon]
MSLPENVGYSPFLKTMSETASNVGKSLGRRKRPSKAVDVSRFGGLTDAVKSRPAQVIPPSLKNLGAITTKYGGSTRYEKFHPGIDIANKIGTPIPAWTGGTVSEIATGKKQGDKGYGNYVMVTDNEGNKHRYSHLDDSYVKVGQQIAPGTVLGGMGATGSTYSLHGGTGSHLDYRIRDLYGRYVDPYKFIK